MRQSGNISIYNRVSSERRDSDWTAGARAQRRREDMSVLAQVEAELHVVLSGKTSCGGPGSKARALGRLASARGSSLTICGSLSLAQEPGSGT